MIDHLQAVVLALVQGLTEFLPISSSAHLILLPRLLDWVDQGLAFDVAVHLGTLLAVVAYFRSDLLQLINAGYQSLRTRSLADPNARLGWAVIVGTIPVGLTGLILSDWIEFNLRDPLVIAAATGGFGIALWAADRFGKRQRDEHAIGLADVVVVGLAQALALVPGTSRSGITITAAMAMGLTREAAARFSFLLAIPVIVIASALKLMELLQSSAPVSWSVIATGVIVAALSAYACIAIFLRVVERIGMAPFAIYRLLLAAALVYLFS